MNENLRYVAKTAFLAEVQAVATETTERTLKLLGGFEEYKAAVNAETELMEQRWNQDIQLIGRLLRAHLYVEHYLTQYLIRRLPALENMEEARLTILQKIILLEGSDGDLRELALGIRHLNKIRNRLAHRLSVDVTNDDAAVFLQNTNFANKIKEMKRDSLMPVDILEEFAKFAALRLSEAVELFQDALRSALEYIDFEKIIALKKGTP